MSEEYLNLFELVSGSAANYSDSIYLVPYEKDLAEITYSQLKTFSSNLDHYLLDLGVSSTARIITILPNSTLSALLTIGTMCSGRCLVPIHAGLAREEIEYICSEVNPELIVHAGVDWLASDDNQPIKCLDVTDYASFISRMIEPNSLVLYCQAKSTDIAEIVFTSGSTGHPKGVMLSHLNILSNSRALASRYRFNQDTKLLTLVPLYHTGGQITTTIGALWGGSKVTVVPPETALYGFWDIVQKFQIDWTVTLTTFLSVLLSKKKSLDATPLQGMLVGGSSVSSELVEAFETRFSVGVYQIYGLTETTSISFCRELDTKEFNLASTGRAVDGCEFQILLDDGSVGEASEVGEICIAGNHVFTSYLNQPDLTAEKFVGKYMRTGDVGYFDSDDNLYVIDRKDNLIIAGGENIYPAEVEKVAPEISGISEFIVCAEEHRLLGHSLVLIYKAIEGQTVDDAKMYEQLRAKLAIHKIPRKRLSIEQLGLEDWPRTASGKIARGAVEELVSGL